MPSYLATWSVFVLDADNPIAAAQAARVMADDHFRSLWGIEECESGEKVTVDLDTNSIYVPEVLEESV